MSEALENSEFLVKMAKNFDAVQASQEYIIDKIDSVDSKLAKINQVEELANSKWTAVDATDSVKGITKLEDALDSSSVLTAATPKSVKDALAYVDENYSKVVNSIYVDAANGNDDNNGLTSATAVKTINKALEITKITTPTGTTNGYFYDVNNIVCIYLATGTYTGNINPGGLRVAFVLQGEVNINGNLNITGRSYTIIQGDYTFNINGRILTTGNSYLVINCPTVNIVHNPSDFTAAVYCDGNSVIYTTPKCTVFNVTANNCPQVMEAYLRGCIIIDNANVTFTVSGITDACVAAYLGGMVKIQKNISINGTSCSRLIVSDVNSLVTIYGILSSSDAVSLTGEAIACYTNSSIILGGGTIYTGTSNGAIAINNSGTVYLSGNFTINGRSSTAFSLIYVNKCSSITIPYGVKLEINSSVRTNCAMAVENGQCWISDGSTLSISGEYSVTVMMVEHNGSITLSPQASVINNATGRRFSCSYGGQFYVGGAGPNRIPGSTDGIAYSSSFGFYA